MILTLLGVLVLTAWLAIGLYFLSKKQANEAYQRGFRNGLAYGLKHKAKKEAVKKNEAQSNNIRS